MPPSMILLCLLFSLSLAIGQVLFKLAANALQIAGGNLVVNALTSVPALTAFGWYGASSFLWLFVLMRVPLSKAYPFALLGSALVPLFAAMFFRERIGGTYLLGTLVVLAGLYIIFGAPTSGRVGA
jgi:drug/metabolite transporter (DMT)-like permease